MVVWKVCLSVSRSDDLVLLAWQSCNGRQVQVTCIQDDADKEHLAYKLTYDAQICETISSVLLIPSISKFAASDGGYISRREKSDKLQHAVILIVLMTVLRDSTVDVG